MLKIFRTTKFEPYSRKLNYFIASMAVIVTATRHNKSDIDWKRKTV